MSALAVGKPEKSIGELSLNRINQTVTMLQEQGQEQQSATLVEMITRHMGELQSSKTESKPRKISVKPSSRQSIGELSLGRINRTVSPPKHAAIGVLNINQINISSNIDIQMPELQLNTGRSKSSIDSAAKRLIAQLRSPAEFQRMSIMKSSRSNPGGGSKQQRLGSPSPEAKKNQACREGGDRTSEVVEVQ